MMYTERQRKWSSSRSAAGSASLRWLSPFVVIVACSGAACGTATSTDQAMTVATSGSPASQASGSSGAKGSSTSAGSTAGAAARTAGTGGVTTLAAVPSAGNAASGIPAGATSTPAAGSGSAGTVAVLTGAGTGTAGSSTTTAGSGAAGPGVAGTGAAGTPATTAPTLPTIEDPGADGPFDVRQVATASGLSSHALFVPSDVASNGKHPLVVWTCGNGGTVDFYTSFLTHLASHGFMIVADKGSSSDRLAEVASQGEAVDWILAENAKQGGDYFGKLDIDRIAVMGHSLGSLASFATAAMNPHIRTSVHYSGGLTGNPVGFDEAPLKTMTKPAAFLCGGADNTAGPSCAMDFTQAPATLPVFYGVLAGASHIGPFGGTPRAGEYGRAGVAWLRWHLADDAKFKPWFADASCTLCSSPWTAMQRNLN